MRILEIGKEDSDAFSFVIIHLNKSNYTFYRASFKKTYVV